MAAQYSCGHTFMPLAYSEHRSGASVRAKAELASTRSTLKWSQQQYPAYA
jgi:hypothetical protein